MDFIKIEKSTPRKPEVLRIATLMGIHPDHAFGLCARFWCWCDDNMTDGTAKISVDVLDAVFGTSGFALALIDVGWLKDRKTALEIPNFDRHLSQSAKVRASATERKRKSRDQHAESNPPSRQPSRVSQKSVTRVTKLCDQRREEKRIEDISHLTGASDDETAFGDSPPDIGPPADSPPDQQGGFMPGQSPAFRQFFERYPIRRAPAFAWNVWQEVVYSLISTRGMTDAQAEAFLLDRVELYCTCPAGLPPPPGQTDFRPNPAKWLQHGVYDEPLSEWMKPNVRASERSRSDRRRPSRRTEKERVGEGDDDSIDALFDQVANSAKRLATNPAPGLCQPAGESS